MIGEATNVSTLLNNERVYKNDQVQKEQKDSEQADEARQQAVTDTTSFSSQAQALSRGVVAAGETPDEQRAEAQGRQQETNAADDTGRSVDIRV